MAKYSSADYDIKVDATDGGALQSMKDHIDTIAGWKITRLLEESTTVGDSWAEQLYSGIRRAEPFTVEGLYDDTATTGPNATFNGTHAATRTVELTFGGTKKSTFEAWFEDFGRIYATGKLTRYRVTIVPTGAVVEA